MTTEDYSKLKIAEIGKRINVHLKRMEADPKINVEIHGGSCRYYHPSATGNGRYVSIRYVTYQGSHTLVKDQAVAYLAWLDAGNNGTDFKCPAVQDLQKAVADGNRAAWEAEYKATLAAQAARERRREERKFETVLSILLKDRNRPIPIEELTRKVLDGIESFESNYQDHE